MKFKILSGVDEKFDLKKNRKDGLFIEKSAGLFKTEKINITGNLALLEQVTEENKTSILKKAGWGTVGALALGPIGLAAGLWLTGKSKEICIACELKSGEKFVATVDNDAFKEFKAAQYC